MDQEEQQTEDTLTHRHIHTVTFCAVGQVRNRNKWPNTTNNKHNYHIKQQTTTEKRETELLHVRAVRTWREEEQQEKVWIQQTSH